MHSPTALVILSIFFCCHYSCNLVYAAESDCNESVCGSIVSKCLLTQSCQCKLPDCSCCGECYTCMGELFLECCDCLGLCPKRNETQRATKVLSQVGDFEGEPQLFESLTLDDDDDRLWTVEVPAKQQQHSSATAEHCTLAYFRTCISANKCSESCESMGAKSFRWFHDGCCECVGPNCLAYGANESRCTECPEEEDENPELTEDHDNGIDYSYENDDSDDLKEMEWN